MPTMSTRLPLMKMAIVNAQKAGLKTSPICSLVMWNAWLSGPAMSPRMANTIEAVAIDRQLATNSLCGFIKHLSTTGGLRGCRPRATGGVRPRTGARPRATRIGAASIRVVSSGRQRCRIVGPVAVIAIATRRAGSSSAIAAIPSRIGDFAGRPAFGHDAQRRPGHLLARANRSDNIPPVPRVTRPRDRPPAADDLAGRYRIQVLDRAVAVLRSLAEADRELTAVEIARSASLHKSTLHRLLAVLEHHRLVQKGPGMYRLGTVLIELGEKASARLTLGERAGAYLRELSAHTGEGAHVTVLSDTEMLAIAHVEGRWNVQSLTRTGLRTQIHCTAAGKAVLAFLPPETCDRLLAGCRSPG